MKRFVTFFCAIALLTSVGQATAGIDDGLIGHWPFDGDADDATGNGHNGTVNGATLTADRDGNPNSAYSFEGTAFIYDQWVSSDDHIVVPHHSQLNLAGNATIALWMQNPDYKRSTTQSVLGKGNLNQNSYSLYVVDEYPSQHALAFVTRTGSREFPNMSFDWDVSYEQWHHIVAVVDDDNGTQSLYVDGVLSSSDAMRSYPWASSNTFPLVFGRNYATASGGHHYNGHNLSFGGKLDDIRIYDRVLTDCEISELAGSGGCNAAPDASGATASLGSLWPPNNKMVGISIEGVTDPDGDEVTITIDSISDDEGSDPDDALASGDTASLRAQRDGNGDGRTYTIEFTADDGNGGTTTGSVAVEVPHDQGNSSRRGRGKPTTESMSWGAVKKSVR